jgi:hypothetical protein
LGERTASTKKEKQTLLAALMKDCETGTSPTAEEEEGGGGSRRSHRSRGIWGESSLWWWWR